MVDSSHWIARLAALKPRATSWCVLRGGVRAAFMVLLAAAVFFHPLRATAFDGLPSHAAAPLAVASSVAVAHQHEHATEAVPGDPAQTDMGEHNFLDHVHENANMPPRMSVSPVVRRSRWGSRNLHAQLPQPAFRVDRPPRA